MATATTSVKKAFDTQDGSQGPPRALRPGGAACSRPSAAGPGQQVRIHHDDEFALYTVSELLHETTDSVVRMGLAGRRRVQPDEEPDEEFDGVLDTKVVDPDLCDKERQRCR